MKLHKNIKNSQIIEENIIISFYPSLCLLRLDLPSPSSAAEFFQSKKILETELNKIVII